MSLPPEVRASYAKIIDSILAASDLTTVSAKQIRKGIQATVDYDITPQKDAIKELIVERFDIINAKRNAASNTDGTNGLEPVANGHVSDDPLPSIEKPSTPPSSASPSSTTKRKAIESDGLPDSVASTPKKKRKPEADADAVLAAKLQAEENLRARPTRGGNTRKAAPAKKKKSPSKSKAKTSKKVKAEDDSDIDDSGSEEKKVNRNTGFHKPLALSPALSELLGGETTLSRPQTTKKIWEYIREHDLQDPTDKRHIICDEKMRAVFKTDRVHMFTMTKILNQNLYNTDE